MKIIQIGPVTPEYGGSYVGGIATHLIQLVNALAKKEVESLILSTSQQDHSIASINVIGMASKARFVNLFIRSPICFIKSALNKRKAGVIKTTYSSYIKLNFSPKDVIIHVHSLHCEFADDLLDEYKVVYTDHGFWQKKGNEKKIENRILKSANVISVSNYARNVLIEKFPSAKSKSTVIYNPINKPTHEELCLSDQIHEKDKIIFFNGYSESLKRKGLDILAQDAIPNLSSEKFQIIADDEGQSYIESKKLRNTDVCGKQPYSKISALYQQSKLMVLPSRSESFGIVYIESASYGVPVVGFKPMVEEFNQYLGIDIGIGFDPDKQTATDLRVSIDNALNETWDKHTMRKIVAQKFSWEFLSKEFVQVYSKINK
ncbi:glycosyltransferase family 4 protein [Vibrio splendidus]|uniref:glycosyltransferase family 4 protein n=1 Tax=Vibrio splendidus TaxID=29497 RepID=UPI000C84CA3E|nr:glycosyltransferase family 4 protein [Vibrio splendidus]PMO23505.1 hypothetical protein BCT15_02410 [Vibrio splendidus]